MWNLHCHKLQLGPLEQGIAGEGLKKKGCEGHLGQVRAIALFRDVHVPDSETNCVKLWKISGLCPVWNSWPLLQCHGPTQSLSVHLYSPADSNSMKYPPRTIYVTNWEMIFTNFLYHNYFLPIWTIMYLLDLKTSYLEQVQKVSKILLN